MIALFATFADKNCNKRKSIPGPHPHVLPNRTTHSLRILQRYPAIFDFLLFRLSETLTLGRKRATRGPSFTFNQPRRFDHDLADLACRRSDHSYRLRARQTLRNPYAASHRGLRDVHRRGRPDESFPSLRERHDERHTRPRHLRRDGLCRRGVCERLRQTSRRRGRQALKETGRPFDSRRDDSHLRDQHRHHECRRYRRHRRRHLHSASPARRHPSGGSRRGGRGRHDGRPHPQPGLRARHLHREDRQHGRDELHHLCRALHRGACSPYRPRQFRADDRQKQGSPSGG